ncbi:MAG TPA: DUF494 family protein [Caldithrix abyssi]|uniref:DUF494 family protein n=1 Tax=Caldithrix abyssi TaxID=187145 RepID=A0A7V5PR73_CALAY|nr:DUF494 family protein [Caldithrix abyssi]
MEERLVEIIVYLLKEFRHKQQAQNYTKLSEELLSQGYTTDEISLAFKWIANFWQDRSIEEDEFKYLERSARILHDVERLVINPEAYGYLLEMRHLGLLSDMDVESVIDRALSMGTATITIDDIKSIVASIIFGLESKHNSWEGFVFPKGSNTIH